MITSPEGLVEVPHVVAPAGAAALARGAVCRVQTEVAALPIVYVPGVRSGPEKADRETIPESDVMRGEEVLGLGLAQRGHLAGGGVVLSLGSHWKAVRVDGRGRVTRSVSTLSGELIHAVRSQTILASAVPGEWPPHLPGDWVEAGLRRARADGLPRALYCVRLLDQRAASTPRERLAFLVGAMIGADVATLLPAPTARFTTRGAGGRPGARGGLGGASSTGGASSRSRSPRKIGRPRSAPGASRCWSRVASKAVRARA